MFSIKTRNRKHQDTESDLNGRSAWPSGNPEDAFMRSISNELLNGNPQLLGSLIEAAEKEWQTGTFGSAGGAVDRLYTWARQWDPVIHSIRFPWGGSTSHLVIEVGWESAGDTARVLDSVVAMLDAATDREVRLEEMFIDTPENIKQRYRFLSETTRNLDGSWSVRAVVRASIHEHGKETVFVSDPLCTGNFNAVLRNARRRKLKEFGEANDWSTPFS